MKKPQIVIILVIVFLVIAVMIYFFVSSNKDSQQISKTTESSGLGNILANTDMASLSSMFTLFKPKVTAVT